jgi:predicted Rossmann-fold nucleotide-binding protein
MRVSVIGGGTVPDEQVAIAEEVGRLLAKRGHTLVCGGLGGVMEAACRGASEAADENETRDENQARDENENHEGTETGGQIIGILPGEDRRAANPYVDVPIATGLGHARNALVVLNGDAVIAIDGGVGTLSEVGFAGVFDRPIAGLETHDAPGVEPVESPVEAVEFVEAAVKE